VGALHEDPNTFMISRKIFRGMRNISNKRHRGNQNTFHVE